MPMSVVYDQVKNRLAFIYEDCGEQTLKNIEKAVRVWRVRIESEEIASRSEEMRASTSSARTVTVGTAYLSRTALVAVGLLIDGAVVTLDPSYADGYVLLSEMLKFSGRWEEAVGMAEKAIRLDPHYPAFYVFTLGSAYLLKGRYEEAIAAYKRALALNPDLLYAHTDLAIVYSELGREAEVRAEAAEALRISPNFSLEVARQSWPLKDPAVLERFLAALRKAGLK